MGIKKLNKITSDYSRSIVTKETDKFSVIKHRLMGTSSNFQFILKIGRTRDRTQRSEIQQNWLDGKNESTVIETRKKRAQSATTRPSARPDPATEEDFSTSLFERQVSFKKSDDYSKSFTGLKRPKTARDFGVKVRKASEIFSVCRKWKGVKPSGSITDRYDRMKFESFQLRPKIWFKAK